MGLYLEYHSKFLPTFPSPLRPFTTTLGPRVDVHKYFESPKRKRLAMMRLASGKPVPFSEEEKKEVEELLRKKMSYREIGNALGRPRNSIIGYVHRKTRKERKQND